MSDVEQAFAPTTTVTVRLNEVPTTITVDWQGMTVTQIQEMAARYVIGRTKPTARSKVKTRPGTGETIKGVDYLPRGTAQVIPPALVKKIEAMDPSTRAALRALLGDA